VVSPGVWLVSSIWFLLPTRLVRVVRLGKTSSICKVVSALVFIRQQYCPSSATLFGQLFPQQRGATEFWMLPSVLEISSVSNTCPVLGGWPVVPLLLSVFEIFLISAGCKRLFWEVGLSPDSHSQCLLIYHCFFTEFSAENLAPCPTSTFQGRFSFPPPPSLSVLDYSSLFIFFSFAGMRGFSLHGTALDYVSRGWVESHA
jgi:hypothetical protein